VELREALPDAELEADRLAVVEALPEEQALREEEEQALG
jgi:hypothetical protein